jgi:hypothetical protein
MTDRTSAKAARRCKHDLRAPDHLGWRVAICDQTLKRRPILIGNRSITQ